MQCETSIRRAVEDPDFWKPSRSLFLAIRHHFPLSDQLVIRRLVDYHVQLALELGASAIDEEERPCTAYTRKGTPCKRQTSPVSRYYCPSHRHLEHVEPELGAAEPDEALVPSPA
jgi:hypothetical protein